MVKKLQDTSSTYVRSLIEASLDPLVTISAQGKITDVNEASVQATGVPRAQLIGTDFSDYFTEPDKARAGYQKAFSDGLVHDYPLALRHTTGRIMDVLYNASVYKDDKDTVLGVFAAARDVTEQKQASQYARSLIEASLDPLVTISAQGKITDVNEASVQATGVPRAQLIGTDFSDYFTEPDKARAGYKKVFSDGLVRDYPLALRHTTGHITDVLYNAAVYKDDKGNVLGVFAAARDISKSVKLVNGLEKTRKELEIMRKAADEAREYAESIINTMREPLIALDQDLRVVTVSRSFYDFFKVHPEETVGQLIYDLGNKQWDIPRLRELLETILPQKTSFDDYEVEHDFATIGRRTMLLNARQIEQVWGKERIILLAIEDITERKEIEAGLEKTRKELEVIKKAADEASEFAENLINTVREPLLSLDQDLRVVTVSRSFYDFFKVKPEETVGQLIYDLGNKQWDLPGLRELLETILPQKTSFDDYEVEHDFATIGRRTMLLNARQIERGIGKEQKRIILLAIEDITERKEIEAGLEKTRKELEVIKKAADEASEFAENLINTVREPLLSLDQDLRVVTVSRSFYDFFKVKPEETVGQLIYDLGNKQWDIPKLRELLETILPQKTTFDNYEVEHDFATIGRRTMLLNARQIERRIGKEQKRIILLAIEDITKRKNMEIELAERALRMEELNNDMASMNKEILKANQSLKELDVQKSDFLANMSHEIRTPMNAIIGMSHLALQTDLTAKQRDYISKVQFSSNALLGIINDILDFSKIEAGQLDMEYVDFQLDTVLENVSNLISQKADEKGLELLISIPQSVPLSLVGDPLRLGQVLTNLANNAVKFTEKGEIFISVELKEKISDKAALRFCVRDTGIGMTTKQMAGLFKAFSQADTSTTRKHGGTGLGLSISKKLVELMAGEISVSSVDGEGSLFSFTVELGLQPTQKQQQESLLVNLAGLRVLVVDDQSNSREILREMLEALKFNVTEADSGENGLAELKKASAAGSPFDLVLMDYKMPGMNGLESAVRIKKDRSLSKTPTIIMITAYGREEIQKQAEDIGLDGFLSKPVALSTMLDTLMQIIGDAEKSDVETFNVAQRPAQLQDIEGARVLLVEDNKINQQVAREILEQAGLAVDLANNGKEAVDLAEKHKYDVIFMDIQMPIMDGFTATNQIRNSKSETRNVPIVAMTAHAMTGDREKSIAAGMVDHVTKPIDPAELYRVLLEWIKPDKGRRKGNSGQKKKSKTSAIPMPSSLPGIDMANGLSRVGNNENLYRSLLKDFYKEYADATGKIKEALAKEDKELGTRLAHTVKGVAGNLGARTLQAAAAELEAAIRNNDLGNIDGLLAIFEQNIKTIMNGLHDFVAAEEAEAGKTDEKETGDPSALLKLLQELEPYVRKKKPAPCMEIMARIDGFSWPYEHSGETAKLSKLLVDYDFKNAQNILQSIIDGLRGAATQ